MELLFDVSFVNFLSFSIFKVGYVQIMTKYFQVEKRQTYIMYEINQQIHMHAACLAFYFGLYDKLIFIL